MADNTNICVKMWGEVEKFWSQHELECITVSFTLRSLYLLGLVYFQLPNTQTSEANIPQNYSGSSINVCIFPSQFNT